MNRTNTLLLACLLSFTSGLINSMGLHLFEVVATNVAGHFGTFLRQLLTQNTTAGFALLAGVLAYAVGAFTATFISEKSKKRHLIMLPIYFNIGVLVGFQFLLFAPSSFIALWLLFLGMGAYNAFASNLTNGQIKPSQLTGLLIDACADTARIAARRHSLADNVQFGKKNQVRWLIIVFFSLGVVINLVANQFLGLSFTILPLLFLILAALILAFLPNFDS
jgi:uncharacterized membrane protein YoaK (UPF0700 family)